MKEIPFGIFLDLVHFKKLGISSIYKTQTVSITNYKTR